MREWKTISGEEDAQKLNGLMMKRHAVWLEAICSRRSWTLFWSDTALRGALIIDER